MVTNEDVFGGREGGEEGHDCPGRKRSPGAPRGSFRAWGEEPAQPKGMCPTPRLSFSRFQGGGGGSGQVQGSCGLLGPGGPSSTSCQTTLAAPFFTPSLMTLALAQPEPPLSHSTPCSNPVSILSLQADPWVLGPWKWLAEATSPVCESSLSFHMATGNYPGPLPLAFKGQSDASFSVICVEPK